MADTRDYASDEEPIDDMPEPAPVRTRKPMRVTVNRRNSPSVCLNVRTNWDGVLAEYMLRLTTRSQLEVASLAHYRADENPSFDNGCGRYDHIILCDVLPDTKSYEGLRKQVESGSQVHVFTRSLNIARAVEDLGWINLKYAADRTASELLWDWLVERGHVDAARQPRCTPYIHDMTVWDWKYAPESMYFYTNIQSEKLNLKYLETLERYSEAEFKRWLERGEIIKKYNEHLIEQFARNPVTRYVTYEQRVYRLLMVESRHFINEIATYLLDHHRVHVAAIYYYDLEAKQWRVSLRAVPDDSIDVGVIANQYGGGGSRSAAAFKHGDISKLFIDKKDVHKVMKELNPDKDDAEPFKPRDHQREDVDPDTDRMIRGMKTLM